MNTQQFDAVIIGNAINGYATAYALKKKKPSLNIAIIGPALRPGAATTAAGAMLGAFGEVTQRSFASAAGKLKHELGVKAAHIWPKWLEEINAISGRNVRINYGSYIILNAVSGTLDDDNYAAIIASLDEHHEPYEKIIPSNIPGLDPIANCRPLDALYIPNEASVNPQEVLASFELAFKALGGITLIDDKVIKIHTTNSKISYIETTTLKIKSDRVLLAAGAYTSELLNTIDDLKYRIQPQLYGIGISLLVEQPSSPLSSPIRTPNRAGACGLHGLPRENNTVYLGATNNLALVPKAAPRMGYINFLIACAIEQINQQFQNSQILSWSVGNRPVSLDGFPLMGQTSVEGLWIIAGTYRDGFHYSPIFSDILSAQMLGEKSIYCDQHTCDQLSMFKPERLPIQTMTKQEAIDEAVLHVVSGSYEHGMYLPRVGLDKFFELIIREKIESIYQKLGINYPLNPDVLMLFILEDPEIYIKFFKDYFSKI